MTRLSVEQALPHQRELEGTLSQIIEGVHLMRVHHVWTYEPRTYEPPIRTSPRTYGQGAAASYVAGSPNPETTQTRCSAATAPLSPSRQSAHPTQPADSSHSPRADSAGTQSS